MSLIRSRWADGQALTTVELQRAADTAAHADDRVYEVLLTPHSAQKKITPLAEETASVNPTLLIVPSATNGKVSCKPAHFVAGTASAPYAITYSATLQANLDAPAIASNSSGSTRYDLVYATVSRTVPNTIASPPASTAYTGSGLSDISAASVSRKVKLVSDGSIATQAINLYDSPTIVLSVNQGFLTGGTPPTQGQINAALPADTSSFNFSLCYLTVANGYTAGTAIAQSAITPTWNRGWTTPSIARGTRVVNWGGSSPSEKPSTPLSERWGSDVRFFFHLKLLTTTPAGGSFNSAVIVDDSIDWRRRVIWGFASYVGNASSFASLESTTTVLGLASNQTSYALHPGFTGTGSDTDAVCRHIYNSGSTEMQLGCDTSGKLRMGKIGSPLNGANGDLILVVLYASDRFVF